MQQGATGFDPRRLDLFEIVSHACELLLSLSNGRSGESSAVDPAFKRLLMYLLVGTKGGFNRLQIMRLIREEPLNPNKIGEKLSLDYKTVQHHLKILKENTMVVTSSPAGTYGAMYFLAPYVEKNISLVDEIWARFGKR